MDNRQVPYIPEAAFNKSRPGRNSRTVATTHRRSTRNGNNEVTPPAPTNAVAPPPVTDHRTLNTSAPAAVPALLASNPHQQLHNDTPRIIRPRPM
ncbi:hypothetical protein C7212DRAFT_337833, partial [Tuber magnatum]